MKKILEARAYEIVRTLRRSYGEINRWKADVGVTLRHTMEIHRDKHSKAIYRYGVEVEMEFDPQYNLHHIALIVRNTMRCLYKDNAYSVQEDSSLKHGFEVVTAPMTYQTLLNMGLIFDDDIVECLSYEDTAGLHITVDPFDDLERERLFFNFFNSPAVAMEFEPLIGRKPNWYCKFRQLTGDLNPIKDHNYAVHMRENRAMEVRLFAAPTKFHEFQRRLHFVHYVNMQIRKGKCRTMESLVKKVRKEF